MPYPPSLVDALQLRGDERVLDVGCGPGSLTHLLAPRVREVVGVDASAPMVAEAERAAAPNERFVCVAAEDLPAGLGTFDVVTLAQSFHWLEQAHVARVLRDMLAPRGRLVHVGATTHEGDGDVPRAAIDALLHTYGIERPAFRSDERRNLAAAGFDGPDEIEITRDDVCERTADDVVASVFSLSYAAPAMFGNRLEEFEKNLRELLGDRRFSERPRGITLLIYKRAKTRSGLASADQDGPAQHARPHDEP
jgi:SAM-dependent methyltransferase